MEVTIDQAINMLKGEEAKLQSLNQRLSEATTLLTELETAKITLSNLPEDKTETLVPLGGGVFLPVVASKKTKVIVSVGAGVSMEKDINETEQFLEEKIETLKKTISLLADQANQTQRNIQALREKINSVLSSRSGTVVG